MNCVKWNNFGLSKESQDGLDHKNSSMVIFHNIELICFLKNVRRGRICADGHMYILFNKGSSIISVDDTLIPRTFNCFRDIVRKLSRHH